MTSRLDAELAARGLARSRSHASQLIAAGVVSVDGKPVVKPSTPVGAASDITVAGADHYVSRAAPLSIRDVGVELDPAQTIA